MKRAMGCGVFLSLVLLLLPDGAVRANVVEAGRRLETLPGDLWLRPAPAPFSIGAEQPVLELPARLTWTRWSPAWAGLRWTAWVVRLDAHPVQRLRGRVDADGSVGRTFLGLGVEAVDLRVSGLRPHRHLRGRVHLTHRQPSLRVGARWEGPLPGPEGTPGSQLELALQVEQSSWGLGLARTSSRYGAAAVWRGGVRALLASSWEISLTASAAEGLLHLAGDAGRLGFRVSLPVATSVGSGPALSLDWKRGKS